VSAYTDRDFEIGKYYEAHWEASWGEVNRLLQQCEWKRSPPDKEEIRRQLRHARALLEAVSAKKGQIRDRYLAQLNRPRMFRESGRPKDVDEGHSDYEDNKTKSGRPGIWRGLAGYILVTAVEEIRTNGRQRSLAQAIRKAIKVHPILKDIKAVHRLTDRALQARYQQAADFWADALERNLSKELDWAVKREEWARTCVEKLLYVLDKL
jgi:hypothetical protein